MDTMLNNLPVQLTSFIGRDHELAEVKRLLTTTRLLTLTGSGGTGKTRLALQVAGEVLNQSADGVWFVELAPLSDPALVPVAIASALGVQQEQESPLLATLFDWLRPKQLLLFLDNCEHLIAACAAFADGALHSSREMRILATSREALGIAGETTYRVPSLDSPTPSQANSIPFAQLTQFPSVQLFSERAIQSLTSFQLTNANAKSVAQICYRLDGIPLAIELAAARVKVLSAEKIAERLDDRFRLLTGGSRTALPRQQTLRGTIDWSHSLLSEPERLLLRRLSVFAGGWTLEAAEAICTDYGIASQEILDLLTHLVDKSLVLPDGQAAETRYHMLETIRQYAREKLLEAQESERLRDQHLEYFVNLAERTEPILYTLQRLEWMPRLESEHDNWRAALEWACERDVETARWLAGLLRQFWYYGDHLNEADAWYTRVLGAGERLTMTKGTALALLGAGTGFRMQLPTEETRTLLEQSVAIWQVLGDQPRLAEALLVLGSVLLPLEQSEEACALFEANEAVFRQSARPLVLVYTLIYWARSWATARGENAKAKALFEESLSIGRRLRDPLALAYVYGNLGLWSLQSEDYEAARRYQLESLDWSRQAGDRHPIALALGYVADVTNLQGDSAAAHAFYTEALALSRAIGNRLYEARLLNRMGYLAVQKAAVAQAKLLLAESMAICRERAFQLGITECLVGYAELRRLQRQVEQAVRLLAAPALDPFHSITGNPFNHVAYQRSIDAARLQLDKSAFAAAWAEGRALTLEQAVADAERLPAAEQSTSAAQTPTAENPAGLSAREVEVLQLLAAGLTNPQIAERLTLSTYTVQAHLRSVYSKLGVTTRVAAARAAAQFKLQ
jgi:predicted ATPase/DNA-binding CsgD family transcriptional regulator